MSSMRLDQKNCLLSTTFTPFIIWNVSTLYISVPKQGLDKVAGWKTQKRYFFDHYQLEGSLQKTVVAVNAVSLWRTTGDPGNRLVHNKSPAYLPLITLEDIYIVVENRTLKLQQERGSRKHRFKLKTLFFRTSRKSYKKPLSSAEHLSFQASFFIVSLRFFGFYCCRVCYSCISSKLELVSNNAHTWLQHQPTSFISLMIMVCKQNLLFHVLVATNPSKVIFKFSHNI